MWWLMLMNLIKNLKTNSKMNWNYIKAGLKLFFVGIVLLILVSAMFYFTFLALNLNAVAQYPPKNNREFYDTPHYYKQIMKTSVLIKNKQ